jgi:hypothetical protein
MMLSDCPICPSTGTFHPTLLRDVRFGRKKGDRTKKGGKRNATLAEG